MQVLSRALKRILIILLTCTGLSACQPGYDDHLEDYINRLENILEVEQASIPSTFGKKNNTINLPKLPSKRATRIIFPELETTAETTIGVLEFMSLNECALQQTIAAKNNNLGKVATQSQQLINSIVFIQQAPACIKTLQDENRTELLEKLQQSLSNKTQQLPFLVWLATINESEYRSFWKTSNIDYHYPASLPPKQTKALQDLFKFIQSTINLQDSSINLEQTLGVIHYGDGGQLLSAYIRLNNQLDVANQLIELALKKPFCRPNTQNFTQANIKILHNMITMFFIPKIQNWSNELNRRYEELMPSIKQLDALLNTVEHPDIKQWRHQRNTVFTKARNATKNHVQMINRLYQQCAVSPDSKSL